MRTNTPTRSWRARPAHAALAAAFTMLAVAGCGGGGDDASPAPPAPPASPASSCGTGGCTVSEPSGSQIVVPAGALAQDTNVAINQSATGAPTLPAGFTAAGQTFAFTPHGTSFAALVTVKVPFDPARVPAGATVVLLKTNAAQTGWQSVAGATVSGNMVSAQVTSLSWFAVGTLASTSGGARISAGNGSAFARTNAGAMYSWGWDLSETLGNGAAGDSNAPVAMSITNASTMATSPTARQALAVRSNGEVWGWGNNALGQLGDGTTTTRALPVAMTRIPTGVVGNALSVATGVLHSLVLLNDGTVLATGRNLRGALGDMTNTDRTRADVVPGLSNVQAIAAGGEFSMALLNDGSVWTWGANERGQLGIGSNDFQSNQPNRVAGLPRIVAIAAGEGFALALDANGDVWAWGEDESNELGDGLAQPPAFRTAPGKVDLGTAKAAAIAAGVQHGLAVLTDGSVRAWGANVAGEVGVGDQNKRASPVAVPGLSGIVAIATGNALSFAVDSAGNLWSWGRNAHGELGLGSSSAMALTPQQVPALNLN